MQTRAHLESSDRLDTGAHSCETVLGFEGSGKRHPLVFGSFGTAPGPIWEVWPADRSSCKTLRRRRAPKGDRWVVLERRRRPGGEGIGEQVVKSLLHVAQALPRWRSRQTGRHRDRPV